MYNTEFFSDLSNKLQKFIEETVTAHIAKHTRKMEELVEQLQANKYTTFGVVKKFEDLDSEFNMFGAACQKDKIHVDEQVSLITTQTNESLLALSSELIDFRGEMTRALNEKARMIDTLEKQVAELEKARKYAHETIMELTNRLGNLNRSLAWVTPNTVDYLNSLEGRLVEMQEAHKALEHTLEVRGTNFADRLQILEEKK